MLTTNFWKNILKYMTFFTNSNKNTLL